MSKIDLDNLTENQNILINKIAKDIRIDFDIFINNISKKHLDDINWIVSSIASRNKYQSPLFYRCVQISF